MFFFILLDLTYEYEAPTGDEDVEENDIDDATSEHRVLDQQPTSNSSFRRRPAQVSIQSDAVSKCSL